MTLLYLQIVSAKNRKIISGGFTSQGLRIQDDDRLLTDLKRCISTVPTTGKDGVSKVFDSTPDSAPEIRFFFKQFGNFVFATITDKGSNYKTINLVFDEIHQKFTSKYNDTDGLRSHYDFDTVIKEDCTKFNSREKLLLGQMELSSTHDILVENLDSLINRGENISNLKNIADSLNLETKEMSKKVYKMKMHARMEQYKAYAVFVIILLFFLYFMFIR